MTAPTIAALTGAAHASAADALSALVTATAPRPHGASRPTGIAFDQILAAESDPGAGPTGPSVDGTEDRADGTRHEGRSTGRPDSPGAADPQPDHGRDAEHAIGRTRSHRGRAADAVAPGDEAAAPVEGGGEPLQGTGPVEGTEPVVDTEPAVDTVPGAVAAGGPATGAPEDVPTAGPSKGHRKPDPADRLETVADAAAVTAAAVAPGVVPAAQPTGAPAGAPARAGERNPAAATPAVPATPAQRATDGVAVPATPAVPAAQRPQSPADGVETSRPAGETPAAAAPKAPAPDAPAASAPASPDLLPAPGAPPPSPEAVAAEAVTPAAAVPERAGGGLGTAAPAAPGAGIRREKAPGERAAGPAATSPSPRGRGDGVGTGEPQALPDAASDVARARASITRITAMGRPGAAEDRTAVPVGPGESDSASAPTATPAAPAPDPALAALTRAAAASAVSPTREAAAPGPAVDRIALQAIDRITTTVTGGVPGLESRIDDPELGTIRIVVSARLGETIRAEIVARDPAAARELAGGIDRALAAGAALPANVDLRVRAEAAVPATRPDAHLGSDPGRHSGGHDQAPGGFADGGGRPPSQGAGRGAPSHAPAPAPAGLRGRGAPPVPIAASTSPGSNHPGSALDVRA